MKDLGKLLSGFTNNSFLSGAAGGVLGGTVSNMMMKNGLRVRQKDLLKYGAVAAAGGLAFKAYQSYSSKNDPQSDPLPRADSSNAGKFQFEPAGLTYAKDTEGNIDKPESVHMLLMHAMITAANADGHIDSTEQSNIFEQVEKMGFSNEQKGALFEALRRPKSVDELIEDIPDPQIALDVYAASALAIDMQQLESIEHMEQLSNKLGIPQSLREAVHEQTKQLG